MAGIVRIHIESDWKDWRTIMNRSLEPTANDVYQEIWRSLNMPLSDGLEIVKCTKDEAQARYDWKEGIDCLFYFGDNTKATLQEKFLDYWENTATFEDTKTSGEPGAWYYCTSQYYFVAYAREYKTKRDLSFQSWILLDLPGLHRLDAQGRLNWQFNQNHRDFRRSTFRYLNFRDIPSEVVIASRY